MLTLMLIGELARKTNLSRHTIRFYEKLGLIGVPAQSRRENNYKEYSEETLRQIAAIRQLTAKGFTLRETKGIIHLLETDTLDAQRGRRYIYHKMRVIEKQIEQLNEMKKSLMEVFENCGSEDCDVRRILNGKESVAF